MRFDGFMKIYNMRMKMKSKCKVTSFKCRGRTKRKVDGKQHFTQPPARFSEASLVKTLEENGIGRPSTYAPTISTILSRKYVDREKKGVIPTEIRFHSK